jgi:hypothetical protein
MISLFLLGMYLGYHHVYQRKSLLLVDMNYYNKQYNQHLMFLVIELGMQLVVMLMLLMRVYPIQQPKQIVHLN